MSVHTTFAPLSPSLFTPHQILYSAPLMLAQQQHIWLGKRYVARWIHVGPKLNRHPIIKQHSANHEPTMRQPKLLNSVPTITQHCAKYHPTVCQPCPSSNIVPTITKLCANHKPTQNQLEPASFFFSFSFLQFPIFFFIFLSIFVLECFIMPNRIFFLSYNEHSYL